jgi:NAD(P)-dependent dehydrogenase (short-subunit alcohol dehydrogenase family)
MRAAKSGAIVNVASGTAFKGAAGMLHYVSSKGAIIAMTRSLANEFAADNVRVNAVSPGFTITESVEAHPEIRDTYSAAAIPTRFLKRNAYAPDVANVMYFLASDDAGFVTGQTIAADGGSVMH